MTVCPAAMAMPRIASAENVGVPLMTWTARNVWNGLRPMWAPMSRASHTLAGRLRKASGTMSEPARNSATRTCSLIGWCSHRSDGVSARVGCAGAVGSGTASAWVGLVWVLVNMMLSLPWL